MKGDPRGPRIPCLLILGLQLHWVLAIRSELTVSYASKHCPYLGR